MSKKKVKIRLRPETWQVEDLMPYHTNVKYHTPRQIDNMILSIKKYGFNDPIGITPEGEIVEGHGRLKALEKIGATEVPVVIIEGLSPKDYDLYRIAHNKLALNTGFDLGMLEHEVKGLLEGSDYSAGDLGFTEKQLKSMLKIELDNDPQDGAAGKRTYNKVDIIFDDQDQKRAWQKFLRGLPGEENESTAGKLDRYIETCGVLGN